GGRRDPRAHLSVLAVLRPRRVALWREADPTALLDGVPGRLDLPLLRRGASVDGVRRHDGQPGMGRDGAVREPARAGREFRRAGGVPPGLVSRAVGARALRGGAAASRSLRPRVHDGGPARVAAPEGARLLRNHRTPRRRRGYDAGRTVPALGDAVGAPPPRTVPRAAHRR